MKLKSKKFVPYYDKIQILPIKEDTFIPSEENQFQEKGKVIAVGEDVIFCKVNDVIFFSSWGVSKTPKDEHGVQYYVVSETSEFILGKESNGSKIKV